MKSTDIRKKFLNYFKQQQHEIVASSSLVPGNDATLLFTNAGMVQFKDVFLGQDKRSYTRATSSQRCVRAGGKHNDLDNVGYTARHHTFFEMLGNFSFGDYFKKEAILFSWNFLTKELQIPEEKLWVTVFQEDDEAFNIWHHDIGLTHDRIIRCGEKSNFWSMGDTGPCGPCTEIFYDHGDHIFGGLPGTPNEDGDRYIEIWNLVFMQFNRTSDGTMTKLPKPSVDTGMGLERLAAVLQGVHNNYDTDIFVALLKTIAQLANLKDYQHASARVIADHIRSCSFLITDGVLPSNEGRGYVLRRIIRRAIRHGNKLGLHDVFFYKLVSTLVQEMGEAYPELKKAQPHIELVLKKEEEQFAKTLEQGLKIFEDATRHLKNKEIPGDIIFKLYDTYGFPVDLTADIARERELTLDMPGFEKSMERQRQQSQSASKFGIDYNQRLNIQECTDFTGYESLITDSMITTIIKDGTIVNELSKDEEGILILDRTPFYAESGGQIGDTGDLQNDQAHFVVNDTQKNNAAHLHHGHVKKGTLRVGEKISTQVHAERRTMIRANHSATHLLHAALQMILGSHVQQKGSLVEAERLRFDFTHLSPISTDELRKIEFLVNEKIRENLVGRVEVMSPDEAKKQGAMALFGEKYGDHVRVLSFGHFSKELCGGTHVHNTGEIGLFKITSETGIASGVRRIEAATGKYALAYLQMADDQIDALATLMKTPRNTVENKVQQLLAEQRELQKNIEKLHTTLARYTADELLAHVERIHETKVLIRHVENSDPKSLRDLVESLKNKLQEGIILLAVTADGKVQLMSGVTKILSGKIKAGDLVNVAAKFVGGQGGGRPDLAQAGGTQPENISTALLAAKEWLMQRLLS
jgi:alanyl-tRNA synthetase